MLISWWNLRTSRTQAWYFTS